MIWRSLLDPEESGTLREALVIFGELLERGRRELDERTERHLQAAVDALRPRRR